MGVRIKSESLSRDFKNSKGQQNENPSGVSEQGHKSMNLEAGSANRKRTPSRSMEIPKEDRQPKV